MNYAYNIRLNLKNKLYNFYEWDINDKIEEFNKLKVLIVDDKTYDDILKMRIVVNNYFLSSILLNNYTCIFTSGIDMVGVRFNINGQIESISKLDLEEECELLDEIDLKKKYYLKYKIIDKNNNYSFNTIEENNIIDYLNKYMDSNKNNKELIDYLYSELFNDNKYKNKYERLIDVINNEYTSNHKKLYELIKMMV